MKEIGTKSVPVVTTRWFATCPITEIKSQFGSKNYIFFHLI